ncbi:MAG: hypothetical protein ACREO1_03925 [Arenimonas sp.]
MMIRRLLAVLILMAINVAAVAATHPVDDRGTRVHQPVVRTKWLNTAPTRQASAVITGVVVVDVQLDTAQWKGKPGKIYMLLAPASAAGPIQASWTVQSEVLLPGNMQSGERVLVYDGAIESDQLRDTLTMTLRADGNRVLRPEIINFTFEIDIP